MNGVDEEFLPWVREAALGAPESIPGDSHIVHMQCVLPLPAVPWQHLESIDLGALPDFVVACHYRVNTITHEEGREAAYGHTRLIVPPRFQTEDDLPHGYCVSH